MGEAFLRSGCTGSYIIFFTAFGTNGIEPINPARSRLITNAYGYGGVLVYIDINGNYNAWDLACPYCASRGLMRPCGIDGLYAVCPECGEHYDVASGTAAPQKGLAREQLLRIPLTNSGGVITVRQ